MSRKVWFLVGIAAGALAGAGCVLASRKGRAEAGGEHPDEAIGTETGSSALPERYRNRRSAFSYAAGGLFKGVNAFVPWHRLPPLVAALNLDIFREELREKNLHATKYLPAQNAPTAGPMPPYASYSRTVDGTYNDLQEPDMGMCRARFGRNVPLRHAYPDPEPRLLEPNPREVSERVLARDTFRPARTLNLLAAAWIQFQTHDWFSHEVDQTGPEFRIELPSGDSWPHTPMRIPRTAADPTRLPGDGSGPPTYLNRVSHWWDASAIYGSNEETSRMLRSGEDGKLRVEGRQIPTDPQTGMAVSGFTDNWWVGLALLHTLFALEHNAICDRLRRDYPSWNDDQLYWKARLINAALLAKIHTVEWTPAILAHPALQIAMNANWWGLVGERLTRLLGRLSRSELLSGIPGSGVNHHTAPFALTEEFVSVYRMHPLIPDELEIRCLKNDAPVCTLPTVETLAEKANVLINDDTRMQDLLYSFGTSHPGAITLHNYPQFLRRFEKREENGTTRRLDLATVDVVRDRERGVPRYNQFRRLLHKPPVRSFAELTPNPVWARELQELYDGEIERVDTMVGMYAEEPPAGFGFSDTAFRVFILMASRRLKSDRFFAGDFTPEVYSPAGLEWIANNNLRSVLMRHYPELTPCLEHQRNAFAPWPRRP